jgi:hypothetical protein
MNLFADEPSPLPDVDPPRPSQNACVLARSTSWSVRKS